MNSIKSKFKNPIPQPLSRKQRRGVKFFGISPRCGRRGARGEVKSKILFNLLIWAFLSQSLQILATEIIAIQPIKDIPVEVKGIIDDNNTNSGILAAEDKTQIIDIEDIIDLTLNQNLDIAISKSRVKQNRGNLFSSVAPLLPSIRPQFSIERFDGGEIVLGRNPINLDRTTYRPTLNADYQIQTGGRDIFNLYASKQRLNKAHASLNQAEQDNLYKALSSYFIWLKDITSIQIAKQSLKEAEEQLAVAKSRFKNGFTTKLEVLQGEAAKADRQSLLLQNSNQERKSQLNLISVLGMSPLNKIQPLNKQIQAENFWTKDFKSLTDEEVLGLAEKNRNDLKELKFATKETKALLGASFSDFMPNISVNGYVRGIGPSLNDLDRTKQGQIFISYDLLRNLGLNTVGQIQLNKGRVEEALINYTKKTQEIHNNILQNKADLELSISQIEVIKNKLEASKEAYRIAQIRMKSGFGINLELLKAQTDLTETWLEYNTALMKFNNAQLALLREIGELKPKIILLKTNAEL